MTYEVRAWPGAEVLETHPTQAKAILALEGRPVGSHVHKDGLGVVAFAKGTPKTMQSAVYGYHRTAGSVSRVDAMAAATGPGLDRLEAPEWKTSETWLCRCPIATNARVTTQLRCGECGTAQPSWGDRPPREASPRKKPEPTVRPKPAPSPEKPREPAPKAPEPRSPPPDLPEPARALPGSRDAWREDGKRVAVGLIARHGSFASAARACRVSQSTFRRVRDGKTLNRESLARVFEAAARVGLEAPDPAECRGSAALIAPSGVALPRAAEAMLAKLRADHALVFGESVALRAFVYVGEGESSADVYVWRNGERAGPENAPDGQGKTLAEACGQARTSLRAEMEKRAKTLEDDLKRVRGMLRATGG